MVGMDFCTSEFAYFIYDVSLTPSYFYVQRPLLSHRPHTDWRW